MAGLHLAWVKVEQRKTMSQMLTDAVANLDPSIPDRMMFVSSSLEFAFVFSSLPKPGPSD